MNEKTNIYVAAHKPFDLSFPKGEGYRVIEVGAAIHDENWGDILDNEGIDISVKNKSYCELTALYWIWKNSQSDIVGLVHYRRFFSRFRIDSNPKYYFTVEQIDRLLKKYDIILPEEKKWKDYTVAEGYDHGAGYIKDLEIISRIIDKHYREYKNSWKKITEGHRASYYNMLICRKKFLDEYCKWLFSVLSEAEQQIDISDYTIAESRVFGYISEILLNVWVDHNRFRVFHAPVVNTETYKGKTFKILALLEHIYITKPFIKKYLEYDFNRKQ